ncbi:unnamed protein product [Periconia digitata]|uniref:Uncharacterized protein n=1 Tax=Periconia digitata TaxID=1303443 RepID=A0A9W4UY60_9PLEO|nr:unnamed protein product [Periconia digitata]
MISRWPPPLGERMQRRWVALCPKPCAADRDLGNSVGAIGSVARGHAGLASYAFRRLGRTSRRLPLPTR